MPGQIFFIFLFAILNIAITNGQSTTTVATTTTVNVTFPGIMNDMDLTEELYNELMGNVDYHDDDEDVHMDNVYKKDDLWRWKDGIIPYEFHQNKTFHQDFKDRIETVIKNINLNLSDCIHIR